MAGFPGDFVLQPNPNIGFRLQIIDEIHKSKSTNSKGEPKAIIHGVLRQGFAATMIWASKVTEKS